MPTVKCKNGSFDISERDVSFLKIYKSSATEEDYLKVHGPHHTIHSPLGYKNINLFMNFLFHPSNELLNEIDIDNVDEMVDAIKTFIDLSCKYSLNEGEIGERLYRYENINNIVGYMEGELSSIKSTSKKTTSIKYDFSSENTIPLAFKSTSFCPYIKIDEVLSNQMTQSSFDFSNESEYILPPYVSCELTDNYEEDPLHTDNYRIIHVSSDYSDANPDKMADYYQKYAKFKDSYVSLFNQDKSLGIISDELKDASSAIENYLREYARCQYLKYNKAYNDKYGIDKEAINASEYSGIEDAIIKYCSNNDPNKSWTDELHVYALSYLIEDNYLPKEEIFELFENGKIEKLAKVLMERDDNSGYTPLSDQEYHELLRLFNIAAGYGEEKPTKEEMIRAANQLACQDFIRKSKTL